MLSQSTVGIPCISRKHPLDKAEFIAPMKVTVCVKEHLHTSNPWNVILNHLNINVLTSDIP